MTDKIQSAEEVEGILLNLFKHDLAACEIYKEVLEHIEDENISQQISKFLGDHEKHVTRLSQIIENITGTTPERTKDLKGILLSGYAAVRSITGQKGALNALQTAETVLFKTYEEAKNQKIEDEEISKLIDNNLQDEKIHNQYVDTILKDM